MGRRARDTCDDSDSAERQHVKYMRLLRDDRAAVGDRWSYRCLLMKLHILLDNELETDALMWLEDGLHFIVQQKKEIKLAQLLGLRVCSLHQVLEALNFDYAEEDHESYTVYRHQYFLRGNSNEIDQIIPAEKYLAMPNIAYSSELKPLEVRLSLADSRVQSCEVTIAPSHQLNKTIELRDASYYQEVAGFNVSMKENSWGDKVDFLDEWSNHDMNSPLWWSQRSDFSTICTDELSEMDTLSQISAYYENFEFKKFSMMETNFQRRAAGHAMVLRLPKASFSPKGLTTKKKHDQKAKDRRTQEIFKFSTLIGRLEDRDTQRQAFATLLESLPGLDPLFVKEIFLLIEKIKKPSRSSTGRMLVLLIAALCKCHPIQLAKLLPRVLSYICLRFRDKRAKTTDACVILVSAIVMYIVPHPATFFSSTVPSLEQSDARSSQQAFQAIAAVLAKESHGVGEAATKCLCGLLYPVDFDGVSVLGPVSIRAHATRIRPFLKSFLADTVAKMDGSKNFATFSPLFLLLHSACQLGRDAYKNGSFPQLGDEFAPHIRSIYEAIENAILYGPRDNWVLRKRGITLLTLLLDVFVLQESAWCCTVKVAKATFQELLERLRTLLLTGRHDTVSLVREAAITATMAFACLEKLCPRAINESHLITSNSYDFISPKPQSYVFTNKRWPKSAAISASDLHAVTENEVKTNLTLLPTESTEELSFGNQEEGDEASPSHEYEIDGDDRSESDLTQDLKSARNRPEDNIFQDARPSNVSATYSEFEHSVPSQDEKKISEPIMDYAEVPQYEEDETSPAQHERSSGDSGCPSQDGSSGKIIPSLSAEERLTEPVSSVLPQRGAKRVVATLKDFKAKQRALVRSQCVQHQVKIPVMKRQMFRNQVESFKHSNDKYEDTALKMDSKRSLIISNLTRAETALKAAQCGEYELALRLCIIEDDLKLLRQTLTIIETPCMENLSIMVRNALCTAFLSLLDDNEDDNSPGIWLALQWLQHWATTDGRQMKEIDPRIVQALSSSLKRTAMATTKASLTAAHVIYLLGL
ncbi:hypothetical protein Plhal304r1_c023g0079481 [Plasmopara halstedii]